MGRINNYDGLLKGLQKGLPGQPGPPGPPGPGF